MSQKEIQEGMNEISTPGADNLSDLPLTDEQADRATGGGSPSGRIYVATNVGVFVS